MLVLAASGYVLFFRAHAATSTASLEAEAGTAGGAATVVNSSVASGGKAVLFDAGQAPPAPTGNVIEDWSSGWDSRWYIASGGSLDKVNQQGLRVPENVEVVTDNGRKVVRIYVRKTTKAYTVGGTTIPAGSWSAGLAQMRASDQHRFGKWEFDFKATAGRGGRVVALLWPGDDAPGWPAGGELDAPEMGDDHADRQASAITNHWANASGGNAQKVFTVTQDHTQWVHVVYRWSSSKITVEYNGRVVATYTDHLPPASMRLALQTAVAKGGWANTFTDASGKTVQRQESYMEVGPISYSSDPNS
jgi:hypothetical protein